MLKICKICLQEQAIENFYKTIGVAVKGISK